MPWTANAADNEWDIGAYDSCMSKVNDQFQSGKINSQQYSNLPSATLTPAPITPLPGSITATLTPVPGADG